MNSISLDNFIRPESLTKERPDLFNNGRIQWILRNREFNGLRESGAVVQIGRRIYLKKDKFIEWLESKTE